MMGGYSAPPAVRSSLDRTTEAETIIVTSQTGRVASRPLVRGLGLAWVKGRRTLVTGDGHSAGQLHAQQWTRLGNSNDWRSRQDRHSHYGSLPISSPIRCVALSPLPVKTITVVSADRMTPASRSLLSAAAPLAEVGST